MEHIKISRLEVMIPMLDEVYVQGKDGVKNIHDDGDGFSVIYDDYSVRYFTNSVPIKIDWKLRGSK